MGAMPRLVDLEDKNFDPFAVEHLSHGTADDPYPLIHELAKQGTIRKGAYRDLFTDVPDVQMGPLDHYMVFGYDAVLEVFTNPDIYTNHDAFKHNLGKSFGRSVSTMDAPEHPRFRKIFQKAFMPNIVTKWGESVVDPVVDALLMKFIKTGRADLVEDFTHHYPFGVVYRQLGLAPEQAPIFHKLAIAQVQSAIGLPTGDEASGKLGAFFQELLELRRAEPADDLITHLAFAEADGERLPDEVIVSFFRQLMNAGGDTTYRGTSVLLVGLLTHPEQLAALRDDRKLIPQAIDEALRWEPPVLTTWRYVSRDTVIDGIPVPKGATLNVNIGSANRDPSKFENPDEFNIFRDRSVRHLAFASGPHVCIGQHLARVEMTRALNALLDRLDNLRLDPDMPPPDIRGHHLRVPAHIHVRFDAV